MNRILFDEDFLRRLELLRMALARAAGTRADGVRLSGPRGGTGEFRDHRNYAHGDEPRYIDWNIYGRLEKIFLKEFTPEHEGRVLLLLDMSASMGLHGKFDFARKILAALAFIGISGGDRVAVVAFNHSGVRSLVSRPGVAGYCELLEFLGALEAVGESGFKTAAARGVLLAAGAGRGRALWVSDFWAEPADLDCCMYPGEKGFAVSLIRVLADQELAPELNGPVEMVDAESGERLVVGGSDESLVAFERSSREFDSALGEVAGRHHGQVLSVQVADSFEAAVLDLIRIGGLAEVR
jgi:hypothetical protein